MDPPRTQLRQARSLLPRVDPIDFPRLAATDSAATVAVPDSDAADAAPRSAAAADAPGNILTGMAILVACQWLGEGLVSMLALPVSGPVAGMVLLFVTLAGRVCPIEPLEHAANGLLRYLPLYFVPAGVGIVQHADRILGEWIPIAVALVAGTIVTLAATAWTMQKARCALATGSQRP